ncbi:hypothetical protein OF897_03300 [Chryseobacterium formosus]|nr:hypothetical protein [Chryseobacterium formosus]MCX8522948.1 hypothetical protein [Chryseobacterium formosus]
MKKNLFLRLCLILMVTLTVYSCRTDHFQEQETYNNSSKFQLTSKRISLDESKHRSLLLPEIEKAEEGLKNSKTSINGKVINYGNGVSIDTDDMIYIENGPNFHTYTFKIKRENAPENTPLENLLLMPTADGSYKEFLVTYNLSAQEREKVRNGEPVNTNGKTTITELVNGTFNSAGQLAKSTMVCGWSNSVHWARCSEGRHGESNYGSCQFVGDFVDNAGNPGFPPYPYLVSTYSCVEQVDETLMPTDPGVGGGGGGGGPAGNGPDECTTVANNPGEVGIINENGCHVGGATQPNDTRPKNPCTKIKEQREDEEFSKRMDTLKGKTGLTKETGYIQKWGGSYEYKANAGATSNSNTLTLPDVSSNDYIKAFSHTHVDDVPNSENKGIKMFSPADVVYFMDLIQNAQTRGFSLSDPYAVMVTSTRNYQIRFSGNKFQIKTFTDQEKEYHREPFIAAVKEYVDNPKQLEFRFLKYIQKEMLLYGITLYRMNTDGTTTEIKLNADKTDTVENTCPN